jgi:DNA-directed RNA polymerase specialized sigma24 family protein
MNCEKRRGPKPPPMMPTQERNELLLKSRGLVFTLARQYRDNVPDVDDLAQEIMVTVALRSGSYAKLKDRVSLASWLRSLAMSCQRAERLRNRDKHANCISFEVLSDEQLCDDQFAVSSF